MIIPAIHINGTGRLALAEQYAQAALAIDDAIKALIEAAPHARDYYIQQDPDAFRKAVAEQESRVARLREVREELIRLHDSVML